MSATLVLPRVQPRARGAHRKPFPAATVVIWGGTSLVCAGIVAAGALGITAPRSACHTEPDHAGWPNSHCHLTWTHWRQP